MDLKKDFNRLVPKTFWARRNSQLGEHLVTQVSKTYEKILIVWMIFDSKF